MAQRTRRGESGPPIGRRSSTAALRESEEQQAVPAGAGDCEGDGAERAVMLRLILEAFVQHLDDDLTSLVAAGEQRSRLGQPSIPVGSRMRARSLRPPSS